MSCMEFIPDGWAFSRLDSITSPVSTTGKKVKTKDAQSSGSFPVIDQGALAQAGYLNDPALVVAASRSAPIVLFGDHTRVVKFITQDFIPGADGTKLMRAEPGISARYLHYLLKAAEIPDRGYGRHYQYLQAADLPVAPESEQRRIADKLDTVLVRVNRVKERLDRLAPLLKRFRQSVLAAATSGKLTADWREQRQVVVEHMDLPTGWTRSTLAAAASNQDNLRRPISEIDRRDRRGTFPYYGASGAIDTIDGYTHAGEFLLIGEDGANLLARSKPIAFRATGQIWVNNHAHVLTHSSVERLDYLNYVINAIDLAPWVTGSAQPKLTRKAMDSIPIWLAPDDEQAEIVRRVELLFGYADRLEARLQAAQTAADRLTPALLAKAFRGELVPQDPNDEPASELLKRLAAARDTSASPRRGRGRKASATIG